MLVNIFRFYYHLNKRASAEIMHFIKFIRIWASENKILISLTDFILNFLFSTLNFCQHASSAAPTHAENVHV